MKSNSTKRALLAGTFLVPQGQNKILFGAKMLSAQDRILSRGSCFLYGTYEQCYAFYDFGSRGLENFFLDLGSSSEGHVCEAFRVLSEELW